MWAKISNAESVASSSSEEDHDISTGNPDRDSSPRMKTKRAKKEMPETAQFRTDSATSGTSSGNKTSLRSQFRAKVQDEKKYGTASYRLRQFDFKSAYPHLKEKKPIQDNQETQKKQEKREIQESVAENDSVNQIKRSKPFVTSDGCLNAVLQNSEAVKTLINVVQNDTGIKSLKLIGNFGGKSKNSTNQDERRPLNSVQPEDTDSMPVLDEQSFKDILGACKRIQSLDLIGCRLNHNNWMELISCVETNQTLEEIRLGGGDMVRAKHLNMLGDSIEKSKSVKRATLRNIEIEKGEIYIFFGNLSGDESLDTLLFENIHGDIKPIFFDTILQLSAHTRIRHLSFSGTRISVFPPDNSSKEWLSAIKKYSHLRVLDLSHCNLSDEDTKNIAKIIELHPWIQELNLEGNVVSEETTATIQSLLSRNKAVHGASQSVNPMSRHLLSQE